jgi:hypothetical protein
MILLIFASPVARITSLNYQSPSSCGYFNWRQVSMEGYGQPQPTKSKGNRVLMTWIPRTEAGLLLTLPVADVS